MFGFFRNKNIIKSNSDVVVNVYDESIGIRNQSDADYRAQRYESIFKDICAVNKKVKSIEDTDVYKMFDSWVVDECFVNDDLVYIPHPIWDEEYALTRSGFSSLVEAEDYIKKVGGVSYEDFKKAHV